MDHFELIRDFIFTEVFLIMTMNVQLSMNCHNRCVCCNSSKGWIMPFLSLNLTHDTSGVGLLDTVVKSDIYFKRTLFNPSCIYANSCNKIKLKSLIQSVRFIFFLFCTNGKLGMTKRVYLFRHP